MNSYRVAEIAKKYTEYDMIQKHTDLPDFPDIRSRLLFAFLNSDPKLNQSSELYALITSLVQLGLDTHDMVSVTNAVKEKKEARSRQLKVLAGDYFSSRFYHLLSQAGQIDLVKQMSLAICEVNRLKLNLYLMMKRLKLPADDYIQLSMEVKAQLYLSFSGLMEDMYKQVWPEILQGFTRCEILFHEIFRAESLQDFRNSWGFWHILQNGSKEDKKEMQSIEQDLGKLRATVHKHNISSQLYQMLDSQIQKLYAKVQQLESDKLVSELFHIGEPFLRYVSKSKMKVLKEI